MILSEFQFSCSTLKIIFVVRPPMSPPTFTTYWKNSSKINTIFRYIDKHSKYYEAEIVKKISPPIIPIAIIIGLNSIAFNTLWFFVLYIYVLLILFYSLIAINCYIAIEYINLFKLIEFERVGSCRSEFVIEFIKRIKFSFRSDILQLIFIRLCLRNCFKIFCVLKYLNN